MTQEELAAASSSIGSTLLTMVAHCPDPVVVPRPASWALCVDLFLETMEVRKSICHFLAPFFFLTRRKSSKQAT
jgi:hypothetical protein